MTTSTTHFMSSEQLMGMAGYSGFQKFIANHASSNASSSENSFGSPSPPSFNGVHQQPHAENPQATMLADDDDLGEDDGFDGCAPSNIDSKPQVNSQLQARNDAKLSNSQAAKLKTTTAERRATHNAIERARRESLNGRFLELARALPTMNHVKRPSKSVIVNKSLEWICESQMREYELLRENAFLRNQLNELRAQLQMDPLPQNSTILQHPTQHVPYKPSGGAPAHPLGPLMPKADATLSSCVPYAIATQQQRLSNPISLHAPGLVSNDSQYSPRNQEGFNHHATGGSFSIQPQANQAFSNNQYESAPATEQVLGECKGPSKPVGLPGPPESTEHEGQAPAFLSARLAVHPESSSSFQSLSEPEAPASSVGSSPRPRIRFFSSSGSSDASENGPPQPHGNGYHAQPECKSMRQVGQHDLAGTLPIDLMAASDTRAELTPRPDGPLSHGSVVGASNLDFATNAPSLASPPSGTGQFAGSAFVNPPTGHHESFGPPQGSRAHGQRHSLVAGNEVGPGMLAMMQQVNGDGHGQISNGYPIGSSWVW